jgi:hypothetical protein
VENSIFASVQYRDRTGEQCTRISNGRDDNKSGYILFTCVMPLYIFYCIVRVSLEPKHNRNKLEWAMEWTMEQ